MSAALLQAVASGVALGLFYAGFGAGFSLVLSTGRLTNVAHGEFVLLGGYILYFVCQQLGWPWPAAVAVSAVGGALLGAALPRSFAGCCRVRPLVRSARPGRPRRSAPCRGR